MIETVHLVISPIVMAHLLLQCWLGFDVPCFCMTERNLMMTLEDGRIKTCRFPAFSALLMLFRQSLRTDVRTILTVLCRLRFSSRVN